MRIRTVKPQFFVNDQLGDMEPIVRVLFLGLVCCADCKGRLTGYARRLKAQILPYDDYDAEIGLDELAEAGLITRYEVDGVPYVHVRTFNRHQMLSGSESRSESKLPPPPEEVPRKCQGSAKEVPRNAFGTLEGKGREGKGVGEWEGKEGETPTPTHRAGRFDKISIAKMLAEHGYSTTPNAVDEWMGKVKLFGYLDQDDVILAFRSIMIKAKREAAEPASVKYIRHVEHLIPKAIEPLILAYEAES